MSSPPLVSCLCVTYRRVGMLRRAVACFLAQTHAARELVILHEDTDTGTAHYLAGLQHPAIRPLVVRTDQGLSLGVKRNILVREALGQYIAVWDDDDWHGPDRLADQLRSVLQSGRPACVLQYELIFNNVDGQAWLSEGHPWENSLFCERRAIPPYADVNVGEDVACVKQLAGSGRLVALSSPHLYVYVYHGTNTCGTAHFTHHVFGHATPLTAAGSQRVAQVLTAPYGPPLALAEVLASRVRNTSPAKS